jgi:threonine/homoserine/homoserine lactone efflux protein
VLFIAGTQNFAPSSEPSTAASIVRLLLGMLLLSLAARQWKSRPKPGEQPTMPKWMRTIDSLGPGKGLGLAFLLSAVNPKNLPLALTAALDIAQASLGSIQSAIMLCLFIVIGSITVGGPVVVYLVMGNEAAKTLDAWRSWLTENNATVMFILFLVLGVVLLGKGISGLSG